MVPSNYSPIVVPSQGNSHELYNGILIHVHTNLTRAGILITRVRYPYHNDIFDGYFETICAKFDLFMCFWMKGEYYFIHRYMIFKLKRRFTREISDISLKGN